MGNASSNPSNTLPDGGYASQNSSSAKKAHAPWTEDEHRLFLLGLENLGKGDWRGISRKYVVTKTPTQVASHAQKYFIRQANANANASRRKITSTLHLDILDQSVVTFINPMISKDPLPTPPTPPSPTKDEEGESMDTTTNSNDVEEEAFVVPKPESMECSYPVAPFCPGYNVEPMTEEGTHNPTAVDSINVNELAAISKLSLGECIGDAEPTVASSFKLVEGSSTESAFHANNPGGGSES